MPSIRWKTGVVMLAIMTWGGTAYAASPKASERVNTVEAMDVSEANDGTILRIEGTAVPTFSVFKLADPPPPLHRCVELQAQARRRRDDLGRQWRRHSGRHDRRQG